MKKKPRSKLLQTGGKGGTYPMGAGGEIDLRLDVVTTRVTAASRVDSLPQAILRFHDSSSLDYRARHGLLKPIRLQLALVYFYYNFL